MFKQSLSKSWGKMVASFGSEPSAGSALPAVPRDRSLCGDHQQSMARNYQSVVALFEVGALDQIQAELGEVDDQVYKDGKRPLHLCGIYGQAQVAKWLLGEGASVHAVDQGAHTPLHLAAKYGHTDVMQLLVQHGAAVNAANKIYKYTPLHMAAKEGQREAAELLIRHGADVGACAKDGVQPLHMCAEKGHRQVAAVLIAAGASPNVKDTIGWTPLHLAIEHKQDGMVELLLKLGADPETPNKNGWTPLHLAAYNCSGTAVRTLLEYGANLEAVNSAGKTPLDLAVEQQHASVVPLLNAQAAAQLACPTLLSNSTVDAPDDALAPVALPGDELRGVDTLLGGLGLKESLGVVCPFCNVDPRSAQFGAEVDKNSTGGSMLGRTSTAASSASAASSNTSMSPSRPGVPSLFVCPLSQRVLKDPVVACDGFTYDRRAIQEFFETGQRISPLTKQPLRSTATLPNHVVRCAVNEWLEWNDRRMMQLQRHHQQQQQQS